MESNPNKVLNERFCINSVHFFKTSNQWQVLVGATDTLNFGKKHMIVKPVLNDGNCIKQQESIRVQNIYLTELHFGKKKAEDFLILFSNICQNCNRIQDCIQRQIN